MPPDLTTAVLLLVVAGAVAFLYLSCWGGQAQFWQPMFGPAAMWACGRGYENPALTQVPSLEDFLFVRTDGFACEDLPDALDIAPPGPDYAPDFDWDRYFPHASIQALIPYQHQHLYLLGAAARRKGRTSNSRGKLVSGASPAVTRTVPR